MLVVVSCLCVVCGVLLVADCALSGVVRCLLPVGRCLLAVWWCVLCVVGSV